MNKQLRWTFLLLIAGVASAGTNRTTLAAQRNPNVVLIFADDLGYGDLGCYGATKVQTPNIDRLAKEGRRFTDAHSASAVCTPSRYAMLTGEYPFRQGAKGAWGPLSHRSGLIVDTNKATLGKVFKNAGYQTACIGKWHLGFGTTPCDWNKPLRPGSADVGFDYYFGVPKVNSGPPYVYVENDRIVGWDANDPIVERKKPASPTPLFPEKSPNIFGGALKAHQLYDDEKTGTLVTEKAVEWIKKNHEKPFFLYFPTPNIHHPFTPAKRFQDTSQCGRYSDITPKGRIRKDAPKEQLYDLRSDPAQQTNVIRDNPERAAKMRERLRELRQGKATRSISCEPTGLAAGSTAPRPDAHQPVASALRLTRPPTSKTTPN